MREDRIPNTPEYAHLKGVHHPDHPAPRCYICRLELQLEEYQKTIALSAGIGDRLRKALDMPDAPLGKLLLAATEQLENSSKRYA